MTRLVLTIGSFALPHLGHAAFLQASAAFGELIVGVNSDAFIATYKGTVAPFTQDERIHLIRALGYDVRLNDGPGRDLICEVEPDVLTIGYDWMERDYLRQIDMTADEMAELGITLVYIPMRPLGISSTEVIRRCRSIAMPENHTSPTT